MLERVSILLNSISWNCANSSLYTTCFLCTPGGLPLYCCTMRWLAFPVGISQSSQINLNLQGQDFTQLYCLMMRRHCTLYRQLGTTSWHVNSTHSSPLQCSTNAGLWTPNPFRHISYLLIQGQSFQENIKTPMPLSISAANRGRTYCDVETQSWQNPSNPGLPLLQQWFAAWQQHYNCTAGSSPYWLQTKTGTTCSHGWLTNICPASDQRDPCMLLNCIVNDSLWGDFVCILLNHNQKRR